MFQFQEGIIHHDVIIAPPVAHKRHKRALHKRLHTIWRKKPEVHDFIDDELFGKHRNIEFVLVTYFLYVLNDTHSSKNIIKGLDMPQILRYVDLHNVQRGSKTVLFNS